MDLNSKFAQSLREYPNIQGAILRNPFPILVNLLIPNSYWIYLRMQFCAARHQWRRVQGFNHKAIIN